MIYTVTLNPSLDYVVRLDAFQADGVNRTAKENIFPGGKGINVAVVASSLGIPSRALGFRAGFTGEALETLLRERGCDAELIPLDAGMTRINVKVKSETEFEINGQGPEIPEDKAELLYEKLDLVGADDMLVLSGSIPGSMPDGVYESILERIQEKHICTTVDASGPLLLNVLKYRPFLVKPNHHELGELFQRELKTEEELVFYARKLQQMGARNVLVSMAEKGAVLAAEDGTVYSQVPPEGQTVNSAGAGDSMVAGFLAGYVKYGTYETALKLGTAAGSATAFTSWLADAPSIWKYFGCL